MKHVMAVITLCSLIVPALVLVDSEAWSRCTPEQRITLGTQGYDKGEVDKACGDSGDDFWNSLSKTLSTALGNGAAKGLNRLDKALGGGGNNHASMCETNYGTCPLSGGPVGHPCSCRAWNGSTFAGISK